MADELIASMVVGANWASSVHGSSAGLRSEEDRSRFLALRRSPEIAALLVGGATVEVEPYRKSPHPLFIFDRRINASLREYVAQIKESINGTILCEGGVRLIHLLLSENLIDSFHLSRVNIEGDDHFLDSSLLHRGLSLISSEIVGATTFERYERASR